MFASSSSVSTCGTASVGDTSVAILNMYIYVVRSHKI